MSKCYRERDLPAPVAVSGRSPSNLADRTHALREATNALGEVLSPVPEVADRYPWMNPRTSPTP